MARHEWLRTEVSPIVRSAPCAPSPSSLGRSRRAHPRLGRATRALQAIRHRPAQGRLPVMRQAGLPKGRLTPSGPPHATRSKPWRACARRSEAGHWDLPTACHGKRSPGRTIRAEQGAVTGHCPAFGGPPSRACARSQTPTSVPSTPVFYVAFSGAPAFPGGVLRFECRRLVVPGISRYPGGSENRSQRLQVGMLRFFRFFRS